MMPNPIWNKPSRNIVKTLSRGSTLSVGDGVGGELEKSLVSISLVTAIAYRT
ncbi:MAG TPA: hypothetical protein V6D26_03115 [Stenomitos sp.]